MVKRTMNGKRLLILAAFAAFATFAMPAAFAGSSISNQTNITVKWNTLAVGSLVMSVNYSATGASQITAPSILQNLNGGTGGGSCSLNGVGSEAAATVNFGNVTADGVDATNCQYKNAWMAKIITSDPNGYTLGVQALAALPASYQVCAIPNGTWANNMAVTQSAAAAATSVTLAANCPAAPGAGKTNMDSTGNQNLFTSAASTAGTNLGADADLLVPPNGAIVNESVLEQFTLYVN
jgi:hypothetical protein